MQRLQFFGAVLFGALLLPAAGFTAPQDLQDPLQPAVPGATAPVEPAYRRETAKERWTGYLSDSVISPRLGIGVLLSSAIAHLNREPREWGMGPVGYLHRVESHWSVNALQGSIHAAGAAALGHDTRYRREPDAGALHRTGHALWRTFFTCNRDGAWTPDATNLASLYAAPMIGTAWHPRRYGPLHQGLKAGDFGVATQAGANLMKEFGPDIAKLFKHQPAKP